MSGQSLPRDCLVEHPAGPDAVERSSRDAEANDPAGVHVNHHHDPIALEQNRLDAEEIDTPQAVFGITDSSEPGGTTAVGSQRVVLYENASDDVLINVDAEGAGDLFGDLAAAEVWVALLHLDNCVYQLPCWTLGSRATSPLGAV